MKNLKKTLLVVAILFLTQNIANAQDDKSQAYSIHEDQVKPSMVSEYEKNIKELIANCEKHNVQSAKWITTSTEDNRYLFVSAIENMAALDINIFASLEENMGKENFGSLFTSLDKCYDKHGNYNLILDKEYTYMPQGITQTPEGKNYRKFLYYHVTPENYNTFLEKGKAIKALFEKKESKLYYRVYRSGFGIMGTYVMVAIAAKNAGDYEQMSEANMELLGEEGQNAFGELLKYTSKFEIVSGRMRPDLGYSPK